MFRKQGLVKSTKRPGKSSEDGTAKTVSIKGFLLLCKNSELQGPEQFNSNWVLNLGFRV